MFSRKNQGGAASGIIYVHYKYQGGAASGIIYVHCKYQGGAASGLIYVHCKYQGGAASGIIYQQLINSRSQHGILTANKFTIPTRNINN